MTGLLLDVNVLLALSWPGHQFHAQVQRWFGRSAAKGWATCPITQAGFVRIISNPAFSSRAVSPAEAIDASRVTMRHPAHQFWADDIPVTDALAALGIRISGHSANHRCLSFGVSGESQRKLATLDKKLAEWAEASGKGLWVDVI